MLTRETDCIFEEGTPCLSSASYVVMPFLPLLCDVRRPRAGCSRPGVTVSGAPAKLRYYKRIAIPYN
ncbi:hypothetical protein L249_2545 [Ophiocordyceps polyrhachis-furcata BCC 54312]|uniref:Uncharacterized protein n=1 Tax=Ophiocordyceps polyrhachis-furcata BCC 54312 TaxID=1330021 RepID=A0A367LQQ6_9HYPO|nr:hypothetical protein L249_2545 [Ophiocordyceps polyrhachis-furcata BCC 54312]